MFSHRWYRALAAVGFLVLLSGSTCDNSLPPGGNLLPGDETTTGKQALFDELWATFDEYYSYFLYKGVDWDDVRDRYRPNFAGDMTDNEFVDELITMLGELADWHVEIMRPDGTWEGTETQEVVTNYTTTPRNKYLGEAAYTTLGNNVVWHAWYQNNIAYIRVDTLSTGAFANITDQQIDDIFARYATADGLILDIRPNNGGNENIATKFASHFTDTEVVYGYTEERNGPSHWDFDPLQEKTLTPAAGNLFLKPVCCLIGQRCLSSAEWFTLMMRACPNVTLIGDATRGGSGFPREFELDNGVKYTVPRWVAYDADLFGIEDFGIDPDIAIAAENSFDGNGDYVVERAIAELTP